MTKAVVERRQAPRMPVQWPVKARVMGLNGDFEGLRSSNVSKRGLCLDFHQTLAKDTVLKLEFTTGEGQPEVRAYAFVAWSTAQGQAGLRFFGIAEEDEDRLAEMVGRFALADSGMASVN
jgi:hypothetical protein